MRWPLWVASLVAIPALIGGCVYYNGMYNANRLAGSARKAEREGRTFEASNLWGQVATKAESVVVRHPTSKYAEQANVLRGVALARLGQCEQAMAPLSRAALIAPSDLTEDALLATGRCQLALGNVAASQAAFGFLLQSKDRDRRREARLQQARFMRQKGQYGEALRLLEGLRDPRAEEERVLALAGSGRLPQALVLADSLLARRDTTKQWDSLVIAMGAQNPGDASQLVDRIQGLPVRSPEVRARQLLEDGMRLLGTDTARARVRFREVIELSGTREAAGRATLELTRMDIHRLGMPADVPPISAALKEISAKFEMVAEQSQQLEAVLAGVQDAATKVTWETPRGDLRLFLAAETARDSLEAPRLATHIFRRILDDFPNSSYAGKVVLAVQQLDPTWSDSAHSLLEGLYSESPYLAMIRGQDAPEYRLLEDSLGAFAAALSARAERPAARRTQPGRKEPARDVDEPRRRPPAPGTSRVPEQ
ncbi:MAG: tetratricopeptide repeat protein [Gemmatimonadales bacterium]